MFLGLKNLAPTCRRPTVRDTLSPYFHTFPYPLLQSPLTVDVIYELPLRIYFLLNFHRIPIYVIPLLMENGLNKRCWCPDLPKRHWSRKGIRWSENNAELTFVTFVFFIEIDFLKANKVTIGTSTSIQREYLDNFEMHLKYKRNFLFFFKPR